jgi:hypothetical protein
MYHQLRVFEEVCMLDRRARRVAAIRRVFHREVMPTPVLDDGKGFDSALG